MYTYLLRGIRNFLLYSHKSSNKMTTVEGTISKKVTSSR